MTANEQTQLALLRGIQRRLWNDHHVAAHIAIRLGDVAALYTGPNVELVAADGFDLWCDGSPLRMDVSEDEAVAALRSSECVTAKEPAP